ncbi:MAG: hypothetical protein WBH68_05810 [Erysipelotrichaceae bacterium]|nr:hypothetical protein [Bacillota bacterium]
MKKILIGILTLLFVLSISGCGKEEASDNEYKWVSYTLTTEGIREYNKEEDTFLSESAPVGQRYIVAEFMGKNMMVKAEDINWDNLDKLVLVDEEGNEIMPGLFSLWGIEFDDKEFTFITNEEQEGFRLIYVVDENIELDNLKLTLK